jgi:hypothetical protein
LIETCKLLPHRAARLDDVIARIVNGHPQTRLDDLMSWGLFRDARASGRG